MATIKVPYTYTEYTHSRLATWVDRFCHMPSRTVWIFLASFLLIGYYGICFSALPLPEPLMRGLSTLGAILVLVLFIGSFFLGMICKATKLSARVAVWDIGGRKITPKMKIVIGVLAAALILPGVCAAGYTLVTGMQASAYHKTMSVLDNADAVAVEGTKAVTFADDRYSKLYIPEELCAEEPEEVRYIVTCTDGTELVGFYGAGGVGGYQRWRQVEVVDRKTGVVLASEIFYGGKPPYSISDDTKSNQYGSDPSEDAISSWVRKALPGA